MLTAVSFVFNVDLLFILLFFEWSTETQLLTALRHNLDDLNSLQVIGTELGLRLFFDQDSELTLTEIDFLKKKIMNNSLVNISKKACCKKHFPLFSCTWLYPCLWFRFYCSELCLWYWNVICMQIKSVHQKKVREMRLALDGGVTYR